MSKLIKAKIDVKKIVKSLLYEGSKCTYLDIDIWINDKPDNYGNDVSIQQYTKKDEPKIYIGSGKTWKPKETTASNPENNEGKFQKEGKATTSSMSDPKDLPGNNDELSDLPF